MSRPDWMNGCSVSLSGLHLYEKHPQPNTDDTAKCRPCGNSAPEGHRVDILEFLEEAEAQIKEEAERRKKQQASYIRAGKVVK